MAELKIKGVIIVETFAEAFPMVGTRIIITAPSLEWALIAARTMTGFATSVIACGAEAGIERTLSPDETLDGRPGVAVLLFTMDSDKLQRQLRNRVGQCVLTSPGSACFAGLEGEKKLKLGASLRFFGDGWQMSKLVAGRRFWRIPVMDGEFLCEATTGLTKKAVGGGNLLVLGKSHAAVLAACERAVKAIDEVEGVITPFPGGIVRSGSKVGSKYKGQIASTNDAYCPTLKAAVNTELPLDVEAVMEIVIDGLDQGVDRPRDALRHPRHRRRRRRPGRHPHHRRQLRRQSRPASFPSQGDHRVSALSFELKGKPDQRLDLSPLIPSRLKDLKPKEIEAIAIGTTRERLTVGDAFKLKGKDASTLQFVGTDARCDKIGAALGEGEIVVDGDAGAYLGAGMKGGTIEVKGSAGVLAGASMVRGTITVSGDVGERAGGILVGETLGMRGGVIAIGGNAGPMLGERMRRGLVVVSGDAGDYAGGRMVAGTILFKRGVGRGAGYGLRRGSLIFLEEPKDILPTFGDCGVLEFDYLRLLERSFRAAGKAIKLGDRARRLMGDMSVLGKGEMLILA